MRILGILGVVFIYTIPFELDKKDENIFYSGFVVSSTGIAMVIYHLIELYLD